MPDEMNPDMPAKMFNDAMSPEGADPDIESAASTDEANEPEDEQIDPKTIVKSFKSKIETAKRNRRNFNNEWKRNVDLRMGKVANQYTGGIDVEDDLQTEINPDWSLTKTKTASLYSQVPAVQITHENKQYADAIPPFAKALNYELGEKRANVGVCMEEVLNDVVNAAGVGAVYVGYAARFETVEVPSIDVSQIPPPVLQQMQATGQIPMQSVERVVDDMFFANRLSPMDLLWPAEFTGSCFDDADWVGYSGGMSWAEAKNEFKLTEEQKDKAVTAEKTPINEDLRTEPEKAGLMELEEVRFDRIFYWRYRVDPNEKSFKAIWQLVIVKGIDKPVVHGPWKGQQYVKETRKYVGSIKFPVRFLTLTYISDNPVPPSDSSAARPQVNDMRRSRSQMFQNRERSAPLRWFNPDKVDPAIIDTIMRGTWQGMIPLQGGGDRAIGEVARANYPTEDLSFDKQVKEDLMDSWQIGQTQPMGVTAAEAKNTQNNFQTRNGQERAKVASFFLGIAEVLAGWMVLYSEFPVLTDEEKQGMFKIWDQKHVLQDLVLNIRPDAAVVLDSSQRIQRLMQFMNMTAKSGFVNIEPIVRELAELSGLDPAEVIKKPQPPAPEEPNMSYRFSGKEDLINPLVMGLLIKHKSAPSAEDIAAAQKILAAAATPPAPPAPAVAPGGQPPVPGQHPPGQLPISDQHTEHPDWNMASKVAKRSRDMNSSS